MTGGLSQQARMMVRVIENHDEIAEYLFAWGVAWRRAKAFGCRNVDAQMPPMDGEQSRVARKLTDEHYWSGVITQTERDARNGEIERASRSFWVNGTVGYNIKKRNVKKEKLRLAIAERDGLNCWFCGLHMQERDRTIEHLNPQSLGGTDDLENLTLCHEVCNKTLGAFPLEKKLEMKLARQAILPADWDARVAAEYSAECG